MRVDVEKMAERWLERSGSWSTGSNGLVSDDGELVLTVGELATFARRVALRCARVADSEIPALVDVDFHRPLTEELGTGYRTGRIAAGDAIRAAVRRGRTK